MDEETKNLFILILPNNKEKTAAINLYYVMLICGRSIKIIITMGVSSPS